MSALSLRVILKKVSPCPVGAYHVVWETTGTKRLRTPNQRSGRRAKATLIKKSRSYFGHVVSLPQRGGNIAT
jgi:hypothetical protein